MSIKSYCDRCGKEVDHRIWLAFYGLKAREDNIDLCRKCYKEVMEFIEG
jgi:hypothetical protein